MFPHSVHAEFKAYAISKYPEEACGLVVGTDAINCKFVPCRNVAENPVTDFMIAPEDYLAASKEGDVLAVLHSHTNGRDYPSGMDMEQQMLSGVPWGIAVVTHDEGTDNPNITCSDPFYFGDQVPIAPLIGRPFRHGVWDCYSLIRDHFRMKGIVFPDYPRDFEWWDKGKNLYLDHYKEVGFVEIDPDDVQEDDCFIMHIKSEVPNHGGVYIGNGLILHHLQWRLSRREPAGPWVRRVSHWLRYEGKK